MIAVVDYHKGNLNSVERGLRYVGGEAFITDDPAQIAKAQAIGDLLTLSERGRRCVHVHLPDNSGVTLRALSQLIQQIFAEKACVR